MPPPHPSDNTIQIPSNPILRLILVVCFNLISIVINKLIMIVAIIQFICHLFSGRVPRWSVRCGVAMTEWTYKMSLFMVYQTERMPFPLSGFGPDAERKR